MKFSLIISLLLLGNGIAFAPIISSPRASFGGRLWAAEPLATEGEWSAFLDQDNTGMVYYFNTKTGESRWDAPTDTFPSIRMDPDTEKLARKKRLEYVESQQAGEPKRKGFLASILTNKKENEKEGPVAEEKKEETTWFDGLFDITPPEQGEKIVSATEKKPSVREEVSAKASKEKNPSILGGLLASPSKEETQSTQVKKEKTTQQKDKPVQAEAAKASKAEKTVFLGGLLGSPSEKTESAPVQKKEKSAEKKDMTVTATKEDNTGFLSRMLGRKSNGIANGKKVDDKPLDVADKVFTSGADRVLKLDTASFVLPHPAKVSWGGEDAVFVKGRSFGVFDGVSGADKLDGVPLFSYTLADEMKRTMKEDGASSKEMINCLAEAADFANRAATGASTALVASIGQDDFLRVLNLGDSVCFVVRNGKVVAKSKEIVHYFDCPYQLSEESPDRAQDGTKLNYEVLPGDVIVMGSDGVFDNLDEETICAAIESAPQRSSAIAKRIVDLSRKISLDEEAATPYAKLAKRNGFEDFQTGLGGKVDDVSCIVVRCT